MKLSKMCPTKVYFDMHMGKACTDQGQPDSQADKKKGEKSPCAPLIVAAGVEEESDEGVVDDGHEEVGVEERVEVGSELPNPAGQVVLGPARRCQVPVHQLYDHL